jgi:hypothetical protein
MSLVASRKGVKKRLSYIRKIGTTDYVPLHPLQDGEQYYWFFSIRTSETGDPRKFRYCRVCAWALLCPTDISAHMFATQYVTHHMYKEKIKYDGKKIFVNYDALDSIVLETRAEHISRHKYNKSKGAKEVCSCDPKPLTSRPKSLKKNI